MKKEIRSIYEIKLEFDSKTENPSRLFQSFADIIDSVSNLDRILAQSVDTKVTSRIFLDDIEKGSLIAKLWDELIISEDGKIDSIESPISVQEYVEETRALTLDFVTNKESSIRNLEKLTEQISNVAKEKELDKTFNYAEPNLLDLAKSINLIVDSTKNLTDKESFSVKSPNREVKEINSSSQKIDLEAVENTLTDQEITNESTIFYKIKRPDFLGDSQWEFKHGSKAIKIKILHDEWLEKFHNGSKVVLPGDSLKVKIKQTNKYNKNGYLISEKIEIIQVLDIIRNDAL